MQRKSFCFHIKQIFVYSHLHSSILKKKKEEKVRLYKISIFLKTVLADIVILVK